MSFRDRFPLLNALARGGEAFAGPAGLTREHLQGLLELGESALKREAHSVALNAFLALQVLLPGRSDVLLGLARAQRGAGHQEEALRTLSQYLEQDELPLSAKVVEALRLRAEIWGATQRGDQDRRRADFLARTLEPLSAP